MSGVRGAVTRVDDGEEDEEDDKRSEGCLHGSEIKRFANTPTSPSHGERLDAA